MEFILLVAVLVVPVVVVIMLVMWSQQQQQIGTIKCNRCGHVGPVRGEWRPARGMVPMCAACGSESWVKVEA